MNSTLGLPEAPGTSEAEVLKAVLTPLSPAHFHSYLEAQSSHTLFVSFN